MNYKITFGDGTTEVVFKETFGEAWSYARSKSGKFSIESVNE
jgi:hypothetical protein